MLDDDISRSQVDSSGANDTPSLAPTNEHSSGSEKWSLPLWTEGWSAVTNCLSEFDLMVATKRWADGTIDVLVAHDPFARDGEPTAHAHRFSSADMTPLSTYGPAHLVIGTVIDVWERPQTD